MATNCGHISLHVYIYMAAGRTYMRLGGARVFRRSYRN